MNTNIFAHRGASGYAPENTMPAFQLAYEQGANGIETDVQLSKDGVPVLIHDETLKRTTNGTGYVKDYTVEELKQLDAGKWFSPKYAGITIVTLEQFLQWGKSKNLLFNIELKNDTINYEKLEQTVYDAVLKYNLLDQTIFSTFNAKSVERMNQIDPHAEVAFLTSSNKRHLLKDVINMGGNALHIHYRLLTERLVKKCKDLHIPLRVYTINRPQQMKRCYKLQCDGIFTDYPDIALTERKAFQSNE
ncbi:glycerophosphodiester phosphodiesterase [Salirhabdus salicampi]|uniref:glycerophosphodiester phosphodiesterase n=1 Tax=Salirhabdus salicampi TaxID=476102 RepID=UPI0020C433E9|nr:glycerophosphodiester phosphodiesterase [Salirhabdus salicampi]